MPQHSNVTRLELARLPAPPIPAGTKIGGDYMPFYGDKAFGSVEVNSGSPAARWAGLRLWWASWTNDIPASLPNDEKMLAELAGYGRDMRGWRLVREKALHNYVLHSDNRWYHMPQVKMVLDLLERRRKDAERKRLKRGSDGDSTGETQQNNGIPPAQVQAGSEGKQGDATLARADVPGELKGRESNHSESPPGDSAAGAASRGAGIGNDQAERYRKAEWDEAKRVVDTIAPAMDKGQRNKLVNSLAVAHGGGFDGIFDAMNTLRDVMRRALTHQLPGYSMSSTEAEKAEVVEKYLWGVVAERTGKGKGAPAATPRRPADQQTQPEVADDAGTVHMQAKAFLQRAGGK